MNDIRQSRASFTRSRTSLAILVLFELLWASAIAAQTITPEQNSAGTVVNQSNNIYDITGGVQSETNLFHSFQEFGLNSGGIANFISHPEINNILGRVTGGNASIINGLIQVTGGNSNLFLINPAGIVFGPNARLNVPADFTATTASGIGFNSGWFNALGINQYEQLIGTPSMFRFEGNGGIVNFGDLNVSNGHQLGLLGSSVLNSGTLTAPGGNIVITAIPGESLVNLSQPGHLLSLEVDSSNLDRITASNLPELLTGGEAIDANQVVVQNDGTIQLIGSAINVPNHTGVALVSGNLDVSNNATAGKVAILADKVALVDANINANGNNGGGNVFLGGDFQGLGSLPNASQTFVSPNTFISANALENGDGGRVILWADKTTRFQGNISATGGNFGGNGGFVEVSGKQHLIFRGNVDTTAPQGTGGTLLLDPENITIVNGNGGANDNQLDPGVPNIDDDAGVIFADDGVGEDFTISERELEDIVATTNIELQANNDITINDLNDNRLRLQTGSENSIIFTADADGNGTGDFVMDASDTILTQGGSISINAVNINVGNLQTSSNEDGGDISLTTNNGNITTNDLNSRSTDTGTGGDITLIVNGENGNIDTTAGQLQSRSVSGDGGDVFLTTNNGNITTNRLDSRSQNIGNSGNITLTIQDNGNITTDQLRSQSNFGDGGDISLITNNGDIITNQIISASSSQNQNPRHSGGNISLTVQGNGSIDTTAGQLRSGSFTESSVANAGTISLGTQNGNITTSGLWSRSNNGGNGGDITLEIIGNGNIDTDNETHDSEINSGAHFGVGGDITMRTQNGDITTFTLKSDGNEPLQSGDITLTVDGTGNINTSAGIITAVSGSDSSTGDGGDISLTTNHGNITTSDLTSQSKGSGTSGDIKIMVQGSGNILIRESLWDHNRDLPLPPDTDPNFFYYGDGDVDTRSLFGNGGTILFSTNNGNITTNNYLRSYSEGAGRAGDITLIANGESGNIDIAEGNLDAISVSGEGGIITVNASGNISNGNIFTRNNNVRMTGTLNLDRDLSINTDGGDIDLEDTTIHGTEVSLTTNAGSGDIFLGNIGSNNSEFNELNFTGNTLKITGNIFTNGGLDFTNTNQVEISGAVTLETDSDNSAVNFSGVPINGSGEITINAGTGQVQLSDIGLISPLSLVDVNATGQTDLSGNIITNGNILLDGVSQVNLTTNVKFDTQSANGEISLNGGGVDGNFTLELDAGLGNIYLGNLGQSIPINSLSVLSSGQTFLQGNIATQGIEGVTINGMTNLLNDAITIDTIASGGNINLNGSVQGDRTLILNSGTGSVNLGQTTNQNISPEGLEITAQNVESNSPLNIGNGGVNINATGTVNLSQSVNTQNNGNVIINNNEQLTIGNGMNLDGEFNQFGSASVLIRGNIFTTDDNISFVSPVSYSTGLDGAINSVEINAGTGTISFGDRLNAGNTQLLLSANEINFNGLVSGNELHLDPGTPTQNIIIGGLDDTEAFDLTAAEISLLEDGFSFIDIGRDDSTGQVTVNLVSFSDPVQINAPQGTLEVDGTITGTDNSEIILNGDIINLNADITTENENITINGNSILGTDVTLDTGDVGAEISINGTVDGNQQLAVNSSTISFGDAIGENTPLSQIIVNADMANISEQLITTGNIRFNSAVNLTNQANVNTSNGNITFTSPINGFFDLTLSAANGSIRFEDAIGTNESLGNLVIPSATTVNTTSSIQANSVQMTANNIQLDEDVRTAGGNIELNVNQSLTKPNITPIDGNTTITSNNQLTTNDITTSGGAIALTNSNGDVTVGNLDSSNPNGVGGDITVSSPTGVVITGDLISTGTSGGNITVMAQTSITTGDINSSGTVRDGGNVLLDPDEFIDIGFINAQGAGGSGGNVDIVTRGFFRSNNTFIDRNGETASISTASGGVGGNVTLSHDGGYRDPNVPFVVGNANTNGTAGVITTGEGNTIPLGSSFPGPYQQGNSPIIGIITGEALVDLLPVAPAPTQQTLTVSPELTPDSQQLRPAIVDDAFVSPQLDPEAPIVEEQTITEDNDPNISSNAVGVDPLTTAIAPPPIVQPPSRSSEVLTDDSSSTVDLPRNLTPNNFVGSTINSTITPIGTIDGDSQQPLVLGNEIEVGSLDICNKTSSSLLSSAFCLLYDRTNVLADLQKLNASIEIAIDLPSTTEAEAETESTAEAEPVPNFEIATDLQSHSEETTPEEEDETESISEEETPSEEAETESILEEPIPTSKTAAIVNPSFAAIETSFTQTFTEYAGKSQSIPSVSLPEAQNTVRRIESETGVTPVLLYVNFAPTSSEGNTDNDPLEIVVVAADGRPIRKVLPATRAEVMENADNLITYITAPRYRRRTSYLKPAQQLYEWIITPIQEELDSLGIENIAFIMDEGLRTLPVAALHDGERFLVETYSVGMMPSLSLTDTRYQNIQDASVLAMGASEFSDLNPLPAVPTEVQTITQQIREGSSFLNQAFTLNNIQSQYADKQYPIVHMATHGEFESGDISNSYIQLWDQKLRLNEIRELGFHQPTVELLVLSACRTAVGSPEAELGFAGLALQAGVKTAIASLWYVSDEGTFGLMTEFYKQLSLVPIKAEAMRQAQLAMINGSVQIEAGQMRGSSQSYALPDSLQDIEDQQLTHPYYWSAFTLIGSPW